MSSRPISMLDSIAGFVRSTPGDSSTKANKIAVIDPSYISGKPLVTFEGESTMSAKKYPYVDSYVPHAGDRVVLAPVGTGYLITGSLDGLKQQNIAAAKEATDFNACIDPGWYYIAAAAVANTHGPANYAYYLEVLPAQKFGATNPWIRQIAYRVSGDFVWSRVKSGPDGTWSDWSKISWPKPLEYYEEIDIDDPGALASGWTALNLSGDNTIRGDFSTCMGGNKFTAPVAGVYSFSASGYSGAIGNTSAYENHILRIAQNADATGVIFAEQGYAGSYVQILYFSAAGKKYMSKGATAYVCMYASGGSVGTAPKLAYFTVSLVRAD